MATAKKHMLGAPIASLRALSETIRCRTKAISSSPSTRICSGFSEVLVGGDFGQKVIRIRSIRRLGVEEYEELQIRYGIVKPEIEQTRQPEEVKGAEVEELD